MDPENTYIRSSTMEDQEQVAEQENTGRGVFEWLKTLVFLGLIFIVGFVAIRMVGPILFSDYIPQILGISVDEGSDSTQPVQDPGQPADNEGEMADGDGADESVDGYPEPSESAEEESGQGEAGAPVEESEGDTAGKVEGEAEAAPETVEVVTYVVKAGDTLTSIAETNGITVEEIVAVNEFLNPHYLQLGQKINIPK